MFSYAVFWFTSANSTSFQSPQNLFELVKTCSNPASTEHSLCELAVESAFIDRTKDLFQPVADMKLCTQLGTSYEPVFIVSFQTCCLFVFFKSCTSKIDHIWIWKLLWNQLSGLKTRSVLSPSDILLCLFAARHMYITAVCYWKNGQSRFHKPATITRKKACIPGS